MMKKVFALLLVASLFFGGYVFAQNFGKTNLDDALIGTNMNNNLESGVGSIIAAILGLLGTIFLVLTIYAGILWMTANGEEAKIDKAKQIISAAVIGLAIVLSAYTITYFVGNKLGSNTDAKDSTGICTGVCKDACLSGSESNGGGTGCPLNENTHTQQSCCLPIK